MELQLGKVRAGNVVDRLELVVQPQDAGRPEFGNVKQFDDRSHFERLSGYVVANVIM